MAIKEQFFKKRLSKTKKISHILARLPFARCIILNGSLAQGKSQKSSDIDILIIARTGRIFTTRFFVILFATIFRIKRSKSDLKSHAGKFCFNYFLTEDFLKIPTGRGEKTDQYCAENYSASKFIAGDRALFEEFLRANEELFEKYNYCSELSPCHPELVSGSSIIKAVTGSRNKFEMTVNGLGNWLEQRVKSYQIKKIESDPRTKKYPDLIVYNDKELRFHPPKS